MRKTLLYGLLVLTLFALLLGTACNGAETTPTPTSAPATATPALTPTGPVNWWDELGEPRYGGTLTTRVSSLALEMDPYNTWGGQYQYYGDFLWLPDWSVDRADWAFQGDFVPYEFQAGNLAESWDMPDGQTMIVHLREGVRWQNVPPVSGREFTADDVVFHYDRMLGTGSGFSEPNPFWLGRTGMFDSVTAVDKYTVQIKLKYPTYSGILTVMQADGLSWAEPPEMVTMEGGFTDWENAVGTGPWLLTDFVEGSAASFSRNPDYWGFDERYPDNPIPYADELKILQIADMSTAVAAVRTGKLDMLDSVPWQQAQTLSASNPELLQTSLPFAGEGVSLRVDHEPFNDIRVRKALQMAIDRETIARSLFSGTVDGIPCGVISPTFTGYATPYEDWPGELQAEYSYNPERARELLDEAGYPGGFETNVVMRTDLNVDLAETFKSYFMDIGVDMAINMMDPASAMPFAFAGKHDQMWWNGMSCSRTFRPYHSIGGYTTGSMGNYGYVSDPAYDALVEDYLACTSGDDAKQLCQEIDMYTIKNHWCVVTFPTAQYIFWHSDLKGFSGESVQEHPYIWARLWKEEE